MAINSPVGSRAFDKLVQLQRRASGQDALGQESTSWTTVASMWAKPEPLRGREYFAAGQMQQSTEVRFKIRYRAGVLQTMRIVWDGLPYEITSVIDVDGKRHTLELMCVQGVRDGR